MRTFTGSTGDAKSPFLDSKFWKKGKKIEAQVLRPFDAGNGICYEILLTKPEKIEGEEVKKVAIGQMAGFIMALNACALNELYPDDKIILECTGTTDTGKGNPRIDFKIAVMRDE